MACANENAHLASVHSAAENDFIQGLVRNAGLSSQGAWIGGSDDGSVSDTGWPLHRSDTFKIFFFIKLNKWLVCSNIEVDIVGKYKKNC